MTQPFSAADSEPIGTGSLDATFGGRGAVRIHFPDGYRYVDDAAFALALQKDRKINAAGRACHTIDFGHEVALARLLPDGSLDPTFGTGGTQVTRWLDLADFSPRSTPSFADMDWEQVTHWSQVADSPVRSKWSDAFIMPSINERSGAVAVVIQEDGKIIAAANFREYKDLGNALVRYLPDGSLDSTFASGGALTDLPAALHRLDALAIQRDGRIVIAGQAHQQGFAIARFLTTGAPDPTFGENGSVHTSLHRPFDIRHSPVNALLVQDDGRIVVVGWSPRAASYSDFVLVRYLPDGSHDPTFGVDGKVTTSFSPQGDRASAAAIQRDGKIVVAGMSSGGLALARYLSSGFLDPTFGTDGRLTASFDRRAGVRRWPFRQTAKSSWRRMPKLCGRMARRYPPVSFSCACSRPECSTPRSGKEVRC